ncbi:hypothetical protein [Coxiella burnetii]|uniref:hypothetical protein n=1 Tax=Coxiella burnetii TaxID=777 RepID=UPI0001632526|nr:hypothetical protein [Coxiella burnetii]APQ67125.1 hypothetical protein A35_09725 [Coxiella burnetii 'MSU Goat Q177']
MDYDGERSVYYGSVPKEEATPLPSNSFHQKKIALGLLLIIDTYGFNIRLRHSRRRESRRTEGALRTCALDSRLRGNDD